MTYFEILEKIGRLVSNIMICKKENSRGDIKYYFGRNSGKQDALYIINEIQAILKTANSNYDFLNQDKNRTKDYSRDINSINKRITFKLQDKIYSLQELEMILNSIISTLDNVVENALKKQNNTKTPDL